MNEINNVKVQTVQESVLVLQALQGQELLSLLCTAWCCVCVGDVQTRAMKVNFPFQKHKLF